MISVLDCTLRDGGYVNNWEFGSKTITQIAEKLCDSSVEMIECGFLSKTKKSAVGQSIFKSISDAEKHFEKCSGNLALMINCGEYAPQDIQPYEGGKIKTIRIAFHKHQRDEAQELCVALKENGYDVFFQPMYTIGYQDIELISLIDWANSIRPKAFYIVDSFGTMSKSDLLRMFYLVDNNLSKDIKLGFHSHNNLQLSFSNAQELAELNTKRELIIDSSVFGMGRGAGNLCTELLTQFINENIEDKYDLIPILEIMDEYIMPIYTMHPWGYSAPYCLAAMNNCHPNYATWLMGKQTICVRDINSIIKSIPEERKHLYDESLISSLYLQYQQRNIDDAAVIEKISALCKDRSVLILAPGKSLLTLQKTVDEYIAQNDPVVFAINHIPSHYKCDKVFMSNLKRFRGIDDAAEKIKDKLIFTSNITDDSAYDLVNYSEYLVNVPVISDNSGLMLINVLRKAGVNAVTLAGYDGFKYDENTNYFDSRMINNVQYEKQKQVNNAIIGYFKKIRKTMEINFITPTIYDGEEDNE